MNIHLYIQNYPSFETCCITWVIAAYRIEDPSFRKMCCLNSKAPNIGRDKVKKILCVEQYT